jgi:predicted transcriptional regulator
MPTKHGRISITNDPELADAVLRARRWFGDAPAATVVRHLALKGVEAVEAEQERREHAIEKLIARSTSPDGFDREVLERIDELAWGE